MLTRAAISKLSREDLENYATKQDVAISELLEKLSNIQNNLSTVQSEVKQISKCLLERVENELSIVKNANTLLAKQMVEVEQKGYSNE